MPTIATTAARRPAAARRTLRRAIRRPRRGPFITSGQLCLLFGLEMQKLAMRPVPPEALCAWCLEHGPKGCPACTQRRKRAVRLAAQGRTVAQIAAEMRLSVPRVERLLEQHAARERERALRVSEVPNAPLRALFQRRQRQDPTFTAAELARRAGLAGASHVDRLLGIIATSDAVKNGRRYPGKHLSTVSVPNAERLLRGLGYEPRAVEHLLAGEEL